MTGNEYDEFAVVERSSEPDQAADGAADEPEVSAAPAVDAPSAPGSGDWPRRDAVPVGHVEPVEPAVQPEGEAPVDPQETQLHSGIAAPEEDEAAPAEDEVEPADHEGTPRRTIHSPAGRSRSRAR